MKPLKDVAAKNTMARSRCRRGLLALAALSVFPSLAHAVTVLVPASPDPTNSTANGNALRAEIDAAIARSGPTTIQLRKGHSFLGTFTLKNKTIDNAYIIIESEGISDGTLPAPGVRVSPSDAPNMAKLLAPSGSGGVYAILTQASAHHYVLRGLEFVKVDGSSHSGLMKLGDDTSAQDTIAEVPHHIELDRCYLHDNNPNHEMFRHIAAHMGHLLIHDCYLSGGKSLPTSGDSQSIAGCNGTGPYWIINNYMEGASETFIIGGAGLFLPDTPGNPTLISDVTFKRNYGFKPLSWLPDVDPVTGYPQWTSGSARNWNVKNLFELKMGRRVDIQGNLFENTWGQYAGQQWAIIIKNTKNSSSVSQNELLTHDILFKHNKIAHGCGAVGTEGRYYNTTYGSPLPPNLKRVSIEHNVFEDITASTSASGPGWGYISPSSRGAFYSASHGGEDVRVQHNTCFNTSFNSSSPAIIFGTDRPPNQYLQKNLVFSNNVCQGDANDTIYGNNQDFTFRGSAAIDQFTDPAFPMAFNHNAIMSSTAPTNITGAHWTNNWWPTAWTPGVILVNQAAGNYNVVNPSIYYTNASPGDGQPIGANLAAVDAATADCSTGIWSAKEIVLYAKDATFKSSHWTVVNDPFAAGEAYLSESDTGASQSSALANPTSYFELTFPAVANTPYHLWIRGKANGNSLNSDSVHVQFSNTLDAVGGSAAYRIGTSGTNSSMEWCLQNGGSDTISGWGFRDTRINGVTTEKQVIFATTGTQTIRIQRKEDGVHIDQIVLSPATYLGRGPVDANPEIAAAQSNPGYEDNDTTILTASQTSGGGSPPPAVAAYEGFNYTGSLNTQNGGSGFGNAWTAVSGQASPALATGSMAYTSGTQSLVTTGNKLQPAAVSRSVRNLTTSFIPTTGSVLWVSFRANHTAAGSFPSNHAGFALYSSTDGNSTGDEFFMGNPGFSGQNWGFNPEGGTRVVAPGDVSSGAPKDVFLLYKLEYGTTNTTVSMWINPSLTESALGTPQATGTQPGLDAVRSVMISTGSSATNYQFDELRLGTAFADVAPAVELPLAAENFNYTGSLNTQNGGTGFGNAWTAVTGQTSPALSTGTMTYTDGTNTLVSSGNKLQPAAVSRSVRNLATPFIPANGDVLWVSFRINHSAAGSFPSNHAGFALYSSVDGTSAGDEFFMGNPGFSGQNWGFNPEGGTRVVAPGTVSGGEPKDVLLLYKLEYGATNTAVSMWINPNLTSEGSLGTPDATGTQPGLDAVRSVMISTGSSSTNYQFDELRLGRSFESVTPKQ